MGRGPGWGRWWRVRGMDGTFPRPGLSLGSRKVSYTVGLIFLGSGGARLALFTRPPKPVGEPSTPVGDRASEPPPPHPSCSLPCLLLRCGTGPSAGPARGQGKARGSLLPGEGHGQRLRPGLGGTGDGERHRGPFCKPGGHVPGDMAPISLAGCSAWQVPAWGCPRERHGGHGCLVHGAARAIPAAQAVPVALGSQLGRGCLPSALPGPLSLTFRDCLRLSSWGHGARLSSAVRSRPCQALGPAGTQGPRGLGWIPAGCRPALGLCPLGRLAQAGTQPLPPYGRYLGVQRLRHRLALILPPVPEEGAAAALPALAPAFLGLGRALGAAQHRLPQLQGLGAAAQVPRPSEGGQGEVGPGQGAGSTGLGGPGQGSGVTCRVGGWACPAPGSAVWSVGGRLAAPPGRAGTQWGREGRAAGAAPHQLSGTHGRGHPWALPTRPGGGGSGSSGFAPCAWPQEPPGSVWSGFAPAPRALCSLAGVHLRLVPAAGSMPQARSQPAPCSPHPARRTEPPMPVRSSGVSTAADVPGACAPRPPQHCQHSPGPACRTGSPPWHTAGQSTAPCARGKAASPHSPSARGCGCPRPGAGSAAWECPSVSSPQPGTAEREAPGCKAGQRPPGSGWQEQGSRSPALNPGTQSWCGRLQAKEEAGVLPARRSGPSACRC